MSTSSQIQGAPRGIPWAEILPQREQQLAKLRQEEQDLQNLISTTNLEEARKALEPVLAVKVARRKGEEKVVAALGAGYDPMTSALGGTWATGLLLEKNPLPWAVRQAWWWAWPAIILSGLLATGGVLFFVATTGPTGVDAVEIVMTILFGVIFAPGGTLGLLTWIIGRVATSAMRKAGLPTAGEVLFLTQDRVPQPALSAFARAQESGLFDSIRVLAPREMFSRVRAGDPIIFGEIVATGDLFLIAQFDLGEDLKHR